MAALTDLNDVDAELTELPGHAGQFVRGPDSARIRTQVIAVDIGDCDEAFVPAGGTRHPGQFPMESGRLQQIGVCIAQVRIEHPAMGESVQGCSALESVMQHATRAGGIRDDLRLSGSRGAGSSRGPLRQSPADRALTRACHGVKCKARLTDSVRTVSALGALRGVLAHRDFRYLFAVRLVGQFGDGLLQAALATFVLFSPERQPDAVRVATSFAILLLPYSLLGPFVGVYLDRWRRRNVLVRANWLKAACAIPIIVLVSRGSDSAALAVSVLVVLGISRFELAGLSASLPHVVSGRELTTANALSPTAGTTVAALGALVGVGVRALLGGGDHGSALLLVGAALCFAGAGVIALAIGANRLGPDGTLASESLRGVAVGLASGIRELRIHAAAGRAITLVGAHRIAFGALTAGGLLLVRLTFNQVTSSDQALTEFAIVTGCAAIGALAGAILTPWMSRRMGSVVWSSLALAQAATLGIGLIVASASVASFALLLVGAFSIGFAGQSVKVCSDTIVQREIPDDHLGRVFALYDMAVNVCLVGGICLVAVVSPLSGRAPGLYIAIGVALVIASWWYWRAGPRRVRTVS